VGRFRVHARAGQVGNELVPQRVKIKNGGPLVISLKLLIVRLVSSFARRPVLNATRHQLRQKGTDYGDVFQSSERSSLHVGFPTWSFFFAPFAIQEL
jgi:hypothetical protein